MFYRYPLTVPANTPASTPVTATMYLAHGIIHQVEVGFPPGCAGLVHAAIFRFEQHAFPTNSEEEFAWDDYNIVVQGENFPLTSAPYTLSLRAWSEDESYPHTIICRIGITKAESHKRGSWVKRLLKGKREKEE